MHALRMTHSNLLCRLSKRIYMNCGHVGPGGLHHHGLPMLGLTTPEM